MGAIAIISYVIVAALVVFFSIKLSNYVDLLDKKTNVSGAFLGGILLAAITSLPELFTSLTAVVLPPNHDNHLVLGNILGSDIFNVCLFAIIYLFFFSKAIKSKINKVHILTMVFVGAMYALAAIGSFVFEWNHWVLGWLNPVSILIFVLYLIYVWKTPKEDEAEDKETDCLLTVKQIVFRFILFSILLVGASIGMTYLVEWISDLFSLGSTFAGALFLGVATSLPELTATITLCRKRNFNAAYGDIVGSNCFNFIILTFADLLSFMVKDGDGKYVGLFKMDQSAFLLLLCGAFSMILTFIAIYLHGKNKAKNTLQFRILYVTISIFLLASYFAFLILSNIDLGISFAPLAH